MLSIVRAVALFLRAAYYRAALDNVGHSHADAAEITWRLVQAETALDDLFRSIR